MPTGRRSILAGIAILASIAAAAPPSDDRSPALPRANPPAAEPDPRFPQDAGTFAAAPVPRSRTAPGANDLDQAQFIQPIDLPATLRLAGARDLDIAIAKQRVREGAADLSQARALWLPSLFVGPTWTRLDGQVQTIQGPVITTSRSALFLGGTAAGGTAIPAAPPGSGYPPVNGLTSILRFSDAIFEPLAARRILDARFAGVVAASNDALLNAAEAFFDLQLAAGRLAIAREAETYAARLSRITDVYARARAGLEADYERARTEQIHQRKTIETRIGEIRKASASLVQILYLDPRMVVAPIEPAELRVRLVPENAALDDLILSALRDRPELAEAQALVQATIARLKQANLRPLVPSLAFSYAGGGFGGGSNAFFGNFSSRGDAAVSLFWQLQNLGFTDRALARKAQAQKNAALLEQIKTQNIVAAEVVSGFELSKAAERQVDQASRALPVALASIRLNFANIEKGAGLPGAPRPIEVLQPIQALVQARLDYLDAVIGFNRAQFQLHRALGKPAPGGSVEPAIVPPPPPR